MLVFLGIELDSIKMEARLPEEKLKKCLGLLKRHGQSKKITVKQLESLTGLLNFACSVIATGRPFLCRMYSLTAGMRRPLPYFTVRLTKGVRLDMRIWETFLQGFNRKSMSVPQGVSQRSVYT